MRARRARPWMTALIALAMPALFGQVNPETLEYSRAGLLEGELWRLASGHLVHFSRSHLLGNLAAFGLLGALVETKHGSVPVLALLLLLAVSTSLLLFLLVPRVHYYGGISAINYGLLAWLCLTHEALKAPLRIPGRQWYPGRMLIVALLAHTAWQYVTGNSLLSAAGTNDGIFVAWQAHLGCVATVFVLAGLLRLMPWGERQAFSGAAQ